MAVFRQLYVQVLIGILLALVLGAVAPAAALAMKPLGDGFMALLRMMMAPIIFCSVVLGLTHIADMRQFGRLAIKTLVYFEAVTTLAMGVGLAAVNLFRPGDGLHASGLQLTAGMIKATGDPAGFTATHFFLSIIPTTFFDAFARGEILQVLLVSLLTGAALSIGGDRSSLILKGIGEFQAVLFRILGFIMRLAPIGAFGAMAAAVGAFGFGALLYLAKVVILLWATSLLFVVIGFGGIAAALGLSIFKLVRLVREELLLVLGTASGEVVLPRLIRKLSQAGCDPAIVGFVLPAGYSFNLDGTSIYLAIAVAFIAQATDTPFSLAQQMGVLAVLLLTSKGGTTVAGGAFVKLAATLQTVRSLPMGGLSLLFGIDRLMATCIALTNVVGNTLAVYVIARWEGGFDPVALNTYLTQQSAGLIDSSGGETPVKGELGRPPSPSRKRNP